MVHLRSRRVRSGFGLLVVMAVLSLLATGPQFRDAQAQQRNPPEAALASRLAPDGTSVVVLLFFASDCPVSNRYQPDAAQLSRAFAGRHVQFWMVYPNPAETQTGITAHQRDFAQPIKPLLDPGQSLVRLAGARMTPEAAVFLPSKTGLREVYLGRIDDRYLSLEQQRPSAQHFDLSDAIEAALDGKPVLPPAGKAVGCSIIPVH